MLCMVLCRHAMNGGMYDAMYGGMYGVMYDGMYGAI